MKCILIAPAHYRIYHTASRRLTQRLGAEAPTAEQLIAHELSHRTPRMIADEYLDHRNRARPCLPLLPGRLIPFKIPSVDPRRN